MSYGELFGETEQLRPTGRERGGPPGEGRFRLRVHWPNRQLAVLEVAGPVDVATMPRFEDMLRVRLASCVSRVVVDLSGVTFLSAGAISVLLRARSQADATGKHLSLITDSHAVDRPLQALDLTPQFAYSSHPVGT